MLEARCPGDALALEDRTARLTILVDPRKKSVFERLCAEEDATPSQIVRRLIRRYIEERTGRPWNPGAAPAAKHPSGARRKTVRRRAQAAPGR
jgi:hypothetical protein